MNSRNKLNCLKLLLSIIISTTLFGADAKPKSSEKPLNEVATAAAWEALGKAQFEVAITNADKCIDEFRGAAMRLQEKLEKEKRKVPNGSVTEEEKKKVFENALLNDVARCLFIKGKAAEKLNHKDIAVKAYEQASKLTHARTWDPSGWFWSPAEASTDRLTVIR